MKQVIKYESDNGALCDTPEEAHYADALHAFKQHCVSNAYHAGNPSAEELADDLLRNRRALLPLLQRIEDAWCAMPD